MSAICQNFVQNAWKKELCSNCFKSKDEHRQVSSKSTLITSVNPKKAIEGIIKNQIKFKPKRSVCFTNELHEVIGYGGEDWSSENEDDEDENDSNKESEEEDVGDKEEEKELKRLTKANTDFNMTSLKDLNGVKKSTYAQLMLGKPQVDSEGKKQTLLVSVTPFGQEQNNRKFTKPPSHIPVAKNNKEIPIETKSNVILTSYVKNEQKEEKSLLDEITETLENSKNPIQIISRKRVQEKENSTEEIDKRKNGLTRATVIKREEKPLIYQTSTAKIELLNTRNSKLNKDNNINNKFIKTERNFIKKTEQQNECDIKNEQTDEVDKKEETKTDETKTEEEISVEKTDYPSREQAGEPDGRADPDVEEPPALPLTPPPPLEVQSSFLHGSPQTLEKPKVPAKPATVAIRKPAQPPLQIEAQNHVLSTFSTENAEEKQKLCKQDSGDSDLAKINNKRRAPRPPEETIYTRNSCGVNYDSPVVREKEKRERASSCSPKMGSDSNINISPDGESPYACIPEAIPRKILSMSTDSLVSNCAEEKRKDKAKGRFSLKKFLRMGNKDIAKLPLEDTVDAPPQPKPRLVIVHPLDLNGAKVQIVSKPIQQEAVEYSVPNNICTPECAKAAKPPPPPRNLNGQSNPKILPTKSAEIINRQKQFSKTQNSVKKVDSVYANIGEVRSAITPNKPQRTASMREREEKQQRGYCNSENVYDYINGRSSSPEYDSGPIPKTSKQNGLKQKSESTIDVSGEYFKFQNIPRSMSLTYCGSETESEIYSPYSCYGSESEVTEDDHDWLMPNGRTHKLRSRKGRSIVHKNLEDNYGAVIVANHEALAQVLENIQHNCPIQPALRGLKSVTSLRWSDFSIKSTSVPVIVGTRAFHQATWCAQNVTLVINAGSAPTSSLSLGTFSLVPITEFSDLIPVKYLPIIEDKQEEKHVQATVAVLPWVQINTLQSFGESLKVKNTTEDTWKDGSFVLLQLVNALKTLQAQGIEELPLSLTSFILCREVDKDANQRLYVFQSLGEEMAYQKECSPNGSLCVCASKAVAELLPNAKTTHLLQSLLSTERASSLTQVKSVLEFTLWGPSDVALGATIRERELALQRWLDLQRATVLHGLVCTRVHLTVYEECHLLFLVRSNVRMMCDASLLLESSQKQQAANGHK